MKKQGMTELMEFADKGAFRKWLTEHCMSSSGVWLLFGKAGYCGYSRE